MREELEAFVRDEKAVARFREGMGQHVTHPIDPTARTVGSAGCWSGWTNW